MKTITKFGLAVLLFLFTGLFSPSFAQSHNVKALGCKYYQKVGTGAAVNTYEVCTVCKDKKEKEQKAKQAEDKRRQEVLVAKTKAENERKAKEAAEKARIEKEKNKPVNAVIAMSPNTSKEAPKGEKDSGDLSDWFDPGKDIWIFYKGSKYSIKKVAQNNRHFSEPPCTLYDDFVSTAIVNRKLETVIAPANETIAYQVIQPTPFAFEYSYADTSLNRACSTKIFNIETKEFIAELSPNRSDGSIVNNYLFQVQHLVLNHKYETTRKFNERIMKIHEKEKFDVVFLPEGNDGYFFWSNGKYRKVSEQERNYILNNN